MNQIKKLAKNTVVFGIGNLGSKLMIFLLVPLYTYFLTPEQLGEADLVVSTVMLFIPLVTLSVADAVIRFGIEKENLSYILNSAMLMIYILLILLVVIYPFKNQVPLLENYYHYFAPLLFFQSIYSVFQQYCRASGRIKVFASSSIFTASVLAVSMFILLNNLKMGIEGFLLAQIVSSAAGVLFLFFTAKIKINVKKLNMKTLLMLLAYSAPLVPNALTWWILQLSDRYLITFFLGASFTGIYVVAVKMPSLVNLLGSIFFQAWQISVFENKENQKEFTKKAFVIFSIFLFSLISILIALVEPFSALLFSKEFENVWQFIPFLFLSALFSSLAAFIATNYLANKNTLFIFRTTLLGAAANIGLNLILIPTLGLQGASIGAMLSFFVTLEVRVRHSKILNKQKFRLNYYASMLVLCIQAGVVSFHLVSTSEFSIFLFLLLIGINSAFIKKNIVEIKKLMKKEVIK